MPELFAYGQVGAVIAAPFVAYGLVRLLMLVAPQWGLLDHPGHRKVHQHSTPLVGGLGMLLAVLLLQLAVGRLPFESWSLLFAVLLVAAIGVADDARQLSHRVKFVAQALGAAIVVSGTSVWVTSLGNLIAIGSIDLGKWSVLVTIISFVGVMNAINMMDGLDGLAGSVVLAPLVLMAGVATTAARAEIVFELLLLAGALMGFLMLNLRLWGRARALVFMGDTGGMILGLLLAWYSVRLGGSTTAVIKPITAVWIIAIPLLDMGSVMLLRLLQRKSPFHGDQQHMHHVLLKAGYSVNQVVGIMAGLSLIHGVIGIGAERSGVPEYAMFLTFLVLWAGYVLALQNPGLVVAVAKRLISPLAERSGTGVT